ncbi:MAG: response regulator transcription factor [Eubacteriales bacterium]
MAEILIVEDDENIARMIEATLSMVGYRCDGCADGSEAVRRILEGSYDLILLDVMLPGMDGFEILTKIKNKGTPVIFLTALQDVGDKVKGLRLGAEDYIVKPFEAAELLARIEVVLRRTNAGRQQLAYDGILVDLQKHVVTKNGERVPLTPKEFDVLVFFMQNVDIAITRERLMAAIWGYEFEGESRTVDIHVQQVRRKLNLKGKLVTIPKLGYCLESR